jgi:3-hydroxymyristoyl/3-hydroxydecanoyl-(acyl carrier protein) dehydratase
MLPPTEIGFAADHPTASGHFPGNPIIPGAVLLDEVLRALGDDTGAVVIRAAKFFHPLRPGEAMRVSFQPGAGDVVKFECHRTLGDILLVSGSIETGTSAA